MSSHRFAVNVTPKPGILDPQGRAVEGSLDHLGIRGVSAVRVGRRVELTVEMTGVLGGVVGRLYRKLTDRYLAMEAAGLKARAEGGASSAERQPRTAPISRPASLLPPSVPQREISSLVMQRPSLRCSRRSASAARCWSG